MNRWTVYVAGPLFSMAEQTFNTFLFNALVEKMPEATFILPQNYIKEISGQEDFFERMFKYCLNSIDKSDVVLCILDGPDVDSGTAVEIGYAYARKIPVVGFRSDFRSLEENGVNLMVSRICTELLWLPVNQIEPSEVIPKIIDALQRVFLKVS